MIRRVRRAACLATVLVLAPGATVTAAQATRAAFPGSNGAIVFSSIRGDGASEIYAMRQDGTDQQRLTRTHPFASAPAWLPSGRSLVFVATAEADRREQLRVMWSDGSHGRLILQRSSIRSPEVSPDGREIAFAQGRAICVVRIDGKGERFVSHPPRRVFDDSPTWSPDGTKIAFTRSGIYPAGGAILVVSARGGGAHTLIHLRKSASQVRWARDGRLGFTDFRGGFARLYTVDARGREERVVLKWRVETHDVERFAWSRDGSRIAYLESDVEHQTETVYVAAANGRGRRAVAVFDGHEGALSWSSRGTIAYDDGDGSLWTVAPDGNGRRLLLRGGSDRYPTLTADGRQIAFAAHDGFDVISADGSDRRTLAPSFAPGPASWSPDASHIAVSSYGIAIVDVASGAETYFDTNTTGGGFGTAPAWSSDGRSVAFAHVYDYSGLFYSELAIGDPTTGAIATLYSTREFATDPDWSPDGTRLAFSLFHAKNGQLGTGAVYTLDRNGDAHLLIANASDPAWSPDGTKIAFVRTVRGNTDIYLANADGTAVTRLTRSPGPDRDPAWQSLP